MNISESDLRLLDAFFQLIIMFTPVIIGVIIFLMAIIGYSHEYQVAKFKGLKKHVR